MNEPLERFKTMGEEGMTQGDVDEVAAESESISPDIIRSLRTQLEYEKEINIKLAEEKEIWKVLFEEIEAATVEQLNSFDRDIEKARTSANLAIEKAKEAEEELSLLKDKLEAESIAHSSTLNNVNELEALKKTLTEELSLLRKENNRLSVEKEKLEEGFHDELLQIKENYDEVVRNNSQNLLKLKEAHSRELNELTRSHEESLEIAKAEKAQAFAVEAAKLKKAEVSLEDEKRKAKEKDSRIEELNNELETFNKALNQLNSDHANEINELNELHIKANKELREELEEAAAAHQKELDSLFSGYKADLDKFEEAANTTAESLNNTIKDLNNEIEELKLGHKLEIDSLEKELSTKVEENESLTQEYSAKLDELEELNNTEKELITSEYEQQMIALRKQSENDLFTLKDEALAEKASALEELSETLTKELETKVKELTLEHEKDANSWLEIEHRLEVDIVQLRKQLETLNSQYEKALEDWHNELEELNAIHEKERGSIESQYNSKVRELEEALTTQISEITKQNNDTLENLKGEHEKTLFEYGIAKDKELYDSHARYQEVLSGAKSKQEALIKDHEAQLELLNTQLKTSEEQVNSLTLELEELSKEREEFELEKRQLSVRIQNIDFEKVSLQKAVDEDQEKLKIATNEINELKSSLEDSFTEKASLTEKVQLIQEENLNLKEENEEYKTKALAVDEILSTTAKEKDSLTAQIAELQASNNQLTDQNYQYTEFNKNLVNDTIEFEKKIETLEAELLKANEALENASNIETIIEETRSESAEEINRITQVKNELKAILEQKETELETYRSDANDVRAELARIRENYEQKTFDLEEERNLAIKKASEFEKSLLVLEDEARNEIERLEKELENKSPAVNKEYVDFENELIQEYEAKVVKIEEKAAKRIRAAEARALASEEKAARLEKTIETNKAEFKEVKNDEPPVMLHFGEKVVKIANDTPTKLPERIIPEDLAPAEELFAPTVLEKRVIKKPFDDIKATQDVIEPIVNDEPMIEEVYFIDDDVEVSHETIEPIIVEEPVEELNSEEDLNKLDPIQEKIEIDDSISNSLLPIEEEPSNDSTPFSISINESAFSQTLSGDSLDNALSELEYSDDVIVTDLSGLGSENSELYTTSFEELLNGNDEDDETSVDSPPPPPHSSKTEKGGFWKRKKKD